MSSRGDVAISVRGLSKSYTLHHNAPETTLAATLVGAVRNAGRRRSAETFWALKDVSFDVEEGDVVGVIGRNGAGKSTLLKILSRITEPTAGVIELYGRVGSLLEVGTGFHPELTGRENIFLNGAILGMTRREIQRQFDAIVDFAEVAQFLDTPVKRYSSGMYVRLAFSVAAHLNPEILIVDEVLAVGDAEFQKKCLGKMQDVSREGGRTVLFVSHSMTSVLQLCRTAIFLEKGRLRSHGPSAQVVDEYISSRSGSEAEVVWTPADAPGDEVASVRAVRLRNQYGEVSSEFFLAEPIIIEMEFWCRRPGMRLNPSFHVNNAYGNCVFATGNAHDEEWGAHRFEPGLYRTRCTIPAHLLNDGQFSVSAFVVRDQSNAIVQIPDCLTFNAVDEGTARRGFTGGWIGVVRPMLPWTMERLDEGVPGTAVGGRAYPSVRG